MQEMNTTRDEAYQIEDADERLSPPKKHEKKISFVSRLPTLGGNSSADNEADVKGSTDSTPPRNLRQAIRVTRAEPQDVETIPTGTQILRPRHFLQIFMCKNDEEFTEISAEQVTRVKQSK